MTAENEKSRFSFGVYTKSRIFVGRIEKHKCYKQINYLNYGK